MANAMPEYGGTVLRPGASGPDIALVQRWLGGLNVDGRYGTSTETAVRRFQREQGLKIDGHVGRDTWDALYRAWADKNGEGEIWPGVTMRRGSWSSRPSDSVGSPPEMQTPSRIPFLFFKKVKSSS